MAAFYEQLDETRFRASTMTRGPWDERHQHAGPPAALLGSALAGALGEPRLARVTFEVLRPVPIGDCTVTTKVLRGGRRVGLAEGTLEDEDGPLLLARGWRIRDVPPEADAAIEADAGPAPDRVDEQPLPAPDGLAPLAFFEVGWDEGYHAAMDVRAVVGAFLELGDATAWLRSRIDLIEGTPITPLQRVLVAADTGNGISVRLPFERWLFVNTDLTVHLHGLPCTDWVGLEARTRFGHGAAVAHSTLHGEQGPIGLAAQSLLVEPRG